MNALRGFSCTVGPQRGRPDNPRWDNSQVRGESTEPERTLFGSFISTYFPSGCFIHRSMIALTIPHPLASETFNWPAKSNGRYDAVPRMTWRVLSRMLTREMYLAGD